MAWRRASEPSSATAAREAGGAGGCAGLLEQQPTMYRPAVKLAPCVSDCREGCCKCKKPVKGERRPGSARSGQRRQRLQREGGRCFASFSALSSLSQPLLSAEHRRPSTGGLLRCCVAGRRCAPQSSPALSAACGRSGRKPWLCQSVCTLARASWRSRRSWGRSAGLLRSCLLCRPPEPSPAALPGRCSQAAIRCHAAAPCRRRQAAGRRPSGGGGRQRWAPSGLPLLAAQRAQRQAGTPDPSGQPLRREPPLQQPAAGRQRRDGPSGRRASLPFAAAQPPA